MPRNAIGADRAREREKQGQRACRDDGFLGRCVGELGGGNLACARLPDGGLAFGKGRYPSCVEELLQRRDAQGDEYPKEWPENVQRKNEDAYEGVGEAVRLEPAVEHEIWEAEIRNRVEAHDDERCLSKEVQKPRHGAKPLLGDLAGEDDEIRCRNRDSDAQKPVREKAVDDIDGNPKVYGGYPEQSESSN